MIRYSFIAIILIALLEAPASATPRKVTLAEAVRLALQIDPALTESLIAQHRTELGILRAQLDRFQLKVDGTLQEMLDRSGIGGPKQYNCSAGGYTAYATKAECLQFMGTVGSPAPTTSWQGLSNLTAQLNYYLFSGFRVEANVKKAKLNDAAALIQIKQQRKDAALAVARAYWNVRHANVLAGVQQAALKRIVEAEEIAEARVQAGLAAPIDKNRATQRKLTQQAAVEDLLGQAHAAAVGLGVMLGIQGEIDIVDDTPVPETIPISPEEMVRDALRRRPEVRHAELLTEVQRQQVRVARSNYYPQLTLSALFQYGNRVYSLESGASSFAPAANPFAGMQGDFNIYANLQMNFFDTLNTYTGVKDALYLERVDEQEELRYERLIDIDVRQAHANLLRLYAKRAPLMTARDVARDNLSIQESRYRNGDALMIDYLDAQIDLSTAELNLADVTASLQEQWLELQAALGFIVGVDNG